MPTYFNLKLLNLSLFWDGIINNFMCVLFFTFILHNLMFFLIIKCRFNLVRPISVSNYEFGIFYNFRQH
jgi:hypothetical protein